MTPEEKKQAQGLVSRLKSMTSRTYGTNGKKVTDFDNLTTAQAVKELEGMTPAERKRQLAKAEAFVANQATAEKDLRATREKAKVNPQTGKVGFSKGGKVTKFKPCAACPSVAKCKAAGKCLAKAKKK